MKNRLVLCFILLLLGVPMHAQWFGAVDLAGGFGAIEGNEITDDGELMVHALARGEFLLGHKTDKFVWKSTLKGKWEPKTTDNARLSMKKANVAAVQKAASTRPLTLSIKQDFQWMPTQRSNYGAWILYQYDHDKATNHSLNINGTEEAFGDMSYYYEVPSKNDHKIETGLSSHTEFDGGRKILNASLKFQAVNSKKYNTWTAVKTTDDGKGSTQIDLDENIKGYIWKYRITPNSTDFKLDADVNFKMKLIDDDISLNLIPGARLSIQHSLDQNSGATRINFTTDQVEEQWKDSTSLRETFNFLSLRAESFIAADFVWKNVEAHADIATQIYGRRLNNETHQQPFKIKGVYPVGKANIKWTISPGHSINFKNEMTVKHPEYLKICWYDRTAGYLDQLYRGNENLRSPQTMLYGLDYQFKYKRFVAKTGISYKHVMDEIDQTWTNEEIDGRMYKVFHWINSADSRSLGLLQTVGWHGRIINANAEIKYNRSRRVSKDNGNTKDSYDWCLKGDITALLGKGWSVGTNVKYQSKVKTFFTMFDQYCELNARITKEFKKFTLFLEGKDLLDRPMETSFESAESQEYWVEVVRSNRRMVILGAKWNF